MTNISTVTCNFRSINGTSIPTGLTIYTNTSLSPQVVCQQNITSASGSVTCTASNINTTRYTGVFSIGTAYGYYPVQTMLFGKASANFADIGWFITLIILIVSALAMVFVNEALGMIGVVIAIVVDAFMGFIIGDLVSLGALFIFAAINVYAVWKRRG